MKNILFCLFVYPLVSLLLAGEKNVKLLSHYSQCLQKEQKMYVYLPVSTGKHSVIYLLHGWSGDYKNWMDKTEIKNIADKFNFIIVMPDGGYESWYSDSPWIKNSLYETYIINELVPFIDSTYDTYKEKYGRGICGLSMGGYGALKLGIKYPSVFHSASALSGVLNILVHSKNWSLGKIFGNPKDNPGTWQENDLLELTHSLRDTIALKFDVGVDDIVLEDNRQFVQVLQKLKFPFEYAEFPGSHNWEYWGTHLEEHLRFHEKNLLR
jgi:putative tributyrin esterase